MASVRNNLLKGEICHIARVGMRVRFQLKLQPQRFRQFGQVLQRLF